MTRFTHSVASPPTNYMRSHRQKFRLYHAPRTTTFDRQRSMRGFDVRLLGAHGYTHALSYSTPIRAAAVSTRRATWTVQRRAISGSSAPSQLKISEKNRQTPVVSRYSEKPLYPAIPLRGFVPSQPLSIRDIDTTAPAKLVTPASLNKDDYHERKIPLADRARWLYKLGRGYLAFYKTGLWNIWQNYKELKKIRENLGEGTLEDLVKYGRPKSEGAKQQSEPVLSRKDYQIALRTRHDLGKLVPFSIVFLICGEFTPLVILAIGSGAVPYTCRIPQQEQSDFLRPVKVQPKYMRQLERLRQQAPETDTNMEWKQEFIEAYRLHANPVSSPIPMFGPIWHQLYAGPHLRKHCEEVLCDTVLIRREGGFEKLSPREVFQWSLKYGLRRLRVYLEEQHQQEKPIDPDSKELKKLLLPAIEVEAKRILNVDWTRLKTEDHWRVVFESLATEQASKPDRRDATKG